jgi:hypothetical protein
MKRTTSTRAEQVRRMVAGLMAYHAAEGVTPKKLKLRPKKRAK